MNIGDILRELGAKSTVLWGVAIASVVLLLNEKFLTPLGIPEGWWWVLPVSAAVSWSMVLTGVFQMVRPLLVQNWRESRKRKKREEYGLKNLETANDFQRAVLLHYKQRNWQRFKARTDALAFHEMVKQGFLDYDSLDMSATMQHYFISRAVWDFLDKPPKDWKDPEEKELSLDWESQDRRL